MKRTVFFVFANLLSSAAIASPASDLDLLTAIQNRDLNGVKQSLKNGANSNLFICDKDRLYPMSHEICQEDKQRTLKLAKEKNYEPLGLFEHIGWYVQHRAMPSDHRKIPLDSELKQDAEIIRMLSLAGAKFDVVYIDYLEKQTQAGFPSFFRYLSTPIQVEVAVEMLANGYIERKLPSAEVAVKMLDESIASVTKYRDSFKTNQNLTSVVLDQEKQINALTSFRVALKFKDNLIYTDASNLDRIQKEAELQAKLRRASEDSRKKQEVAEEQARLRAEEQQRNKEKAQIASFRKLLRDGDDTNCGPVIEVKGKLIKVAYAVANYGNEHWVKRNEIFPAGYDCRFYNGQYQSPQ